MPTIDPAQLAASLRRLRSNDGNRELHDAIEQAVSACVALFAVDGSGLMLADEQNALRYIAANSESSRVLEDVQARTGQGPCVDTFVLNEPVSTSDLTAEQRWPRSRARLVEQGIRSVLGVPIRVGATAVGSLDVYRLHRHDWDDSEVEALNGYSTVVESMLSTALTAQSAGQLADQLQYALDNRVVIDRAIGFVMAAAGVDAPGAFSALRSAARRERRKVAELARDVLGGRVPPPPPDT